MHPIVFLVGLHGSGKSSIGRHLVRTRQWRHLSLGDIGRLARKNLRPSDVSLRLISCLAAHRPGETMPDQTCLAIANEVLAYSHAAPVVCDGFPIDANQLNYVPIGSKLILIQCSDDVRTQRLLERGVKTVRQWTPGNGSVRDDGLPFLLQAARGKGLFVCSVENERNGESGLAEAAEIVFKSCALTP